MATTALEPAPPPSVPMTEPARGYRPYRLTVDRYHRMVEAGVFTRKDHVFLWEGQLVEKMTKNPPHNHASSVLNTALVRLVPDGWHVRPEQPIVLNDRSEPEPDLTVIRGAFRDYADHRPFARDVALVIEVADSSLTDDSIKSLETYAREAIPVYWLVNLPRRRIEAYQRPEGARYTEHRFYGSEEEIPVVLDGRQIGAVPVRDILP